MKKYIILTAAFIIFGCEKIPDEAIQPENIEYQVLSIAALNDVSYPHDSSFATSVKFDNSSKILEVWLDFYSPAEIQLNSSPVIMKDNGDRGIGDLAANDGIFSAKLSLGSSDVNGKYRIDYFAKDIGGNVKLLAKHHFNYDNGQVKYVPVISDLVMPDTIEAGENNKFTITLKASDQNGLGDIKNVFFKFIRLEDNSESGIESMNDEGDSIFGDAKAHDGIYSYKSYFLETAKGKSRQFVFQAIDRNDSLSNIITHNIYIK